MQEQENEKPSQSTTPTDANPIRPIGNHPPKPQARRSGKDLAYLFGAMESIFTAIGRHPLREQRMEEMEDMEDMEGQGHTT
jgi:hypothetical protein